MRMSSRNCLLALLAPTLLIGLAAACFIATSPPTAQAYAQQSTLVAGAAPASPQRTSEFTATTFDNAIFVLSPALHPQRFVACVDNPYFPLIPGTIYTYAAQTDEGLETIVVTVTDQIRQVMGISATVVRDTVWLDDELIEDTDDWFAQDQAGNVWYMGETTAEYENGQIVSTAGSWEAGIGGAQAGIYMLEAPFVGDVYRQEYWKGEAIDMAAIHSLDDSITVPFGEFAQTLTTTDYNPLAGGLEHKTYATGVGPVLETPIDGTQRTELISITHERTLQDADRECGGDGGGVAFVGTLPVAPGTQDLQALALVTAAEAAQVILDVIPGASIAQSVLAVESGFLVYIVTLDNGQSSLVDAGDAGLLTTRPAPPSQLFVPAVNR